MSDFPFASRVASIESRDAIHSSASAEHRSSSRSSDASQSASSELVPRSSSSASSAAYGSGSSSEEEESSTTEGVREAPATSFASEEDAGRASRRALRSTTTSGTDPRSVAGSRRASTPRTSPPRRRALASGEPAAATPPRASAPRTSVAPTSRRARAVEEGASARPDPGRSIARAALAPWPHEGRPPVARSTSIGDATPRTSSALEHRRREERRTRIPPFIARGGSRPRAGVAIAAAQSERLERPTRRARGLLETRAARLPANAGFDDDDSRHKIARRLASREATGGRRGFSSGVGGRPLRTTPGRARRSRACRAPAPPALFSR